MRVGVVRTLVVVCVATGWASGSRIQKVPSRKADLQQKLTPMSSKSRSSEERHTAGQSNTLDRLAVFLLELSAAVAFNPSGAGARYISSSSGHASMYSKNLNPRLSHRVRDVAMFFDVQDILDSFGFEAEEKQPLAADTPVVILPGFGNEADDYYTPLGQPAEEGMVAALERRGFTDVTVLPLKRFEWTKVAGGLFDGGFYSGSQTPYGNAYGWYVERARGEIKEAASRKDSKVLVVGHSAGGWLARAVLGDGVTPWDDDDENRTVAQDYVQALVTLGAPNFPPPDLSTCATRGALKYVSEQFPGAFLSPQGVRYVTVVGDSITGNDVKKETTEDNGELDELYSVRGEGSAQRVAFTNYQLVGGDGTLTGDGVIPIEYSHLSGATQITLDGVRHSFNEAGTTQLAKSWYGSDEVVQKWIEAAGVSLG